MNYTRTTISIPAHVLAIGQERAAHFRISFSELVARLIEEEARAQRKTLTLVAEDPAQYRVRVAEEPPRVYGETISPKEAKRRERRAAAKKKKAKR